MEPLIYRSSGMLGDFIHNLSVVYENFLNTGRMGVIYISNHPAAFRFPLDITYRDLEPIISNQSYIEKFSIWNNEPYDIDLDLWRKSPYLYKADWYKIYKGTYNVDWGLNPWISLPKLSEYRDKVVVSMSVTRAPRNINKLKELYTNNIKDMIFVSDNDTEYAHFVKLTRLKIPFIKAGSLYEKGLIIGSCKYFISNMTSGITIANGCGVPRLLLSSGYIDDVHNIMPYWKDYEFI
jgi:hypothetical protein